MSNEILQSSRFGGRKTSPPGNSFVSDSRTPLKLLHYHKKKTSVCSSSTNKPIVACSLTKYAPKNKTKENLMLSCIDSDDNVEDYNYLDHKQDHSDLENWKNEYEFPSNGRNNYYHKRRTSTKIINSNKHMTQANSPLGYFHEGESQNIQMNYGKGFAYNFI
jgi:hypothetical protein